MAAARAGRKLTGYHHTALVEEIAPNQYRVQFGTYIKKANATSLSETCFVSVLPYIDHAA